MEHHDQDAIDQLESLGAKLDGDPHPHDWMVEGTLEKDTVRDDVDELAALIALLL